MKPDKMERTMRFIVETQAQTAASIQKHEEALAALEKNAGRHEREIQTVTNLIGRLAVAETHLNKQMSALAHARKETNEHLKETDERLNALSLIVDKIIRGRNGGAKL